MKVLIEIHSDNDFEVLSPIGRFSAHGPDLKHVIELETEDELRKEVVWFLSQLEIRLPDELEYDMCRNLYSSGGHDQSFKKMIYEAMHQIALTGQLEFHHGGNRELHIGVI